MKKYILSAMLVTLACQRHIVNPALEKHLQSQWCINFSQANDARASVQMFFQVSYLEVCTDLLNMCACSIMFGADFLARKAINTWHMNY